MAHSDTKGTGMTLSIDASLDEVTAFTEKTTSLIWENEKRWVQWRLLSWRRGYREISRRLGEADAWFEARDRTTTKGAVLMSYVSEGLADFVRESNRIEGITRGPTESEIAAHETLLELPRPLTVQDLCVFVSQVAGAPIRDQIGMDVTVGSYRPPRGGYAIRSELAVIVMRANAADHYYGPYELHCKYEKLHPFLDGNGRSGRALWARHMIGVGRDPFALPFLQGWYYESLGDFRG